MPNFMMKHSNMQQTKNDLLSSSPYIVASLWYVFLIENYLKEMLNTKVLLLTIAEITAFQISLHIPKIECNILYTPINPNVKRFSHTVIVPLFKSLTLYGKHKNKGLHTY
jgi:hypothetical protein